VLASLLVVTALFSLDGTVEAVAASPESSVKVCKLAILRPTLLNVGDEDAYLASLVADILAVELGRGTPCEIVTEADIESMIAFEGQKQSLGCDADAPSCLSEIGDALGVDQVVTGSVTRAGDKYALSLRKVDVANARVEARVQVFSRATPEALAVASRDGVAALLAGQVVGDTVALEDDESDLAPFFLWGGVGTAAFGALVASIGLGGAGVSLLLIADENGDGNLRGVAFTAWLPLLIAGVIGVVIGLGGTAAAAGSFAL
jgi:TolB-like protein